MIKLSQTIDSPSHEVSRQRAVHADHLSHGAGRLLLAIGIGAVVGMATIVGDMVSSAFLIFILIMSIRGYLLGVMKIVAGVLGLLAAIQWAQDLAPQLAKVPQLMKVTDKWNQIPESIRELIILISAGLLIGVAVMIMTRILAQTMFRKKPHWKWVDRWFGAAMGGTEGIVLSAIILFAALMLEPIARQHLEAGRQETAGQFSRAWPSCVISLTTSVRASSAGKILESLEPLRLRFNQQMQVMTGNAGDGNEPDNLFQSNLHKMVEQMRGDSSARSILSSQTGLDDATLRGLLDSPEFKKTLKEMTSER